MTHSKDIPLDPKALDWAGIDDAFHVGLSHYTNVSLPNSVAKPLHDWIESQRASLRPAADPKAEGPWPPIEQAIEIGPEPVVEWEDPRVQAVYEILCRDFRPPNEGEHREGYQARLIVDALAPPTPDAERAGEPVGYVAGMGMTLLKEGYSATIWPMTAAGDLADDTEHPLYAQSPATEAVSEALTNIDYLIDDVVADAYVHGAEGRSTEVSPHSAKTLHDAIAALIRPPVNNSPEPEHIVADVSKTAAEATKP